jgi:hypothetical protein
MMVIKAQKERLEKGEIVGVSRVRIVEGIVSPDLDMIVLAVGRGKIPCIDYSANGTMVWG